MSFFSSLLKIKIITQHSRRNILLKGGYQTYIVIFEIEKNCKTDLTTETMSSNIITDYNINAIVSIFMKAVLLHYYNRFNQFTTVQLEYLRNYCQLSRNVVI